MNTMQQFERLALEQMDALYTKAIGLAKDMVEAEALVQETYLKAFQKFYQFDSRDNFDDWLFRILYEVTHKSRENSKLKNNADRFEVNRY